MPAFICVECGSQHAHSETPPESCVVCLDERWATTAAKQRWTTLTAMRATHRNAFRRLEPGLMGCSTEPAFGGGHQALLLRATGGNILWDCVSYLDEATIAIVTALGGVSAIAASHPHCYASMVEWSHAFNSAPIFLPAVDRKFVTRLDPAIHFWEDDMVALVEGVTLLRCGGHFAGSTALHWAQASGGRGALLSGDTVEVLPNGRVGFMRSHRNMIPLDAASVGAIAEILSGFPFDAIYGSTWDRVVATKGQQVLAQSARRYVEAIVAPPAD
jgi:glyoxylase-like metal-dependent hydrolase (beta-lactamase superfamily II)